jgi:hypothetical protein
VVRYIAHLINCAATLPQLSKRIKEADSTITFMKYLSLPQVHRILWVMEGYIFFFSAIPILIVRHLLYWLIISIWFILQITIYGVIIRLAHKNTPPVDEYVGSSETFIRIGIYSFFIGVLSWDSSVEGNYWVEGSGHPCARFGLCLCSGVVPSVYLACSWRQQENAN